MAINICYILPSLILANSNGRQNDLIHPPICIFINFKILDICMNVKIKEIQHFMLNTFTPMGTAAICLQGARIGN